MNDVEKLARVLCTLDGKNPDAVSIIGVYDDTKGWSLRNGREWEKYRLYALQQLAKEPPNDVN